MGYHRAGFDVVGVDLVDQPNYPFEFHRADALEFLNKCIRGSYLPMCLCGHALKSHRQLWGPDGANAFVYSCHDCPCDDSITDPTTEFGFDAIHASPPCQAFTVYRNARPDALPKWPDLVAPTRDLLEQTGLPWVIENVPGAPLKNPIQLCGTSFGIPVRRHRLFESSVMLMSRQCDHGAFTERRFPGSTNRPNGRTVCNVGEYRVPLAQQQEAMGIDWMTLTELSQAIPPAYTEFIGQQLFSHLMIVR